MVLVNLNVNSWKNEHASMKKQNKVGIDWIFMAKNVSYRFKEKKYSGLAGFTQGI